MADLPAPGPAPDLPPTAGPVTALAPTGVLRVAVNLGNPVLATGDAEYGARGLSVDLGRALAERLGVACELVVVTTAKASLELVTGDRADVGFFAVDPQRGADIAFSAPYVLIEGAYAVRGDSPVRGPEQVDVAGTEVVVGRGSAYDLFLTRELRHATLVRAASSQAVVADWLARDPAGPAVAAGVRQQLEADTAGVPGVRVLPGRFMTIRQAVGVSHDRGEQAAAYVAAYVEEQKASGFVADALARHGVDGAALAPPEPVR